MVWSCMLRRMASSICAVISSLLKYCESAEGDAAGAGDNVRVLSRDRSSCSECIELPIIPRSKSTCASSSNGLAAGVPESSPQAPATRCRRPVVSVSEPDACAISAGRSVPSAPTSASKLLDRSAVDDGPGLSDSTPASPSLTSSSRSTAMPSSLACLIISSLFKRTISSRLRRRASAAACSSFSEALRGSDAGLISSPRLCKAMASFRR